MNKTIGIDTISFHVPSLYLPIEELAKARDIEFAKLNKGLGLTSMALCDVNEDVATMAAEAALRLIVDNKIDPRTIGRIYMGTESALDAAKPTATYVMHILEQKMTAQYGERCFKNCDVVDMTFACVGGVDALLSSRDWVRLHPDRAALVIAADLAKYDLASSGEYTQGAGAVAMLVKETPRLLALNTEVGVATESVHDFFKPRRSHTKGELLQAAARLLGKELSETDVKALLDSSDHDFWGHPEAVVDIFKEEPVFDGPYSNTCYQNRIFEALEHYEAQKGSLDVLADWKHLVFHLPYAFQGRRMLTEQWVKWIAETDDKATLQAQVKVSYPEVGSEAWAGFVKAASKTPLYKNFVANRIEKGERASSYIGNMYTASIFMSLISLLRLNLEEGTDVTGDIVGFFSYGSGSKSKVFTGEVMPTWKEVISMLDVFTELESRTAVDFETYEKLHKKEITQPIIADKNIYLNKIGAEGADTGFRYYAVN